jgi:hypothetical protein
MPKEVPLINYTPHTVTVRPVSGGPDFVYPPSGIVPRVEMTPRPVESAADGCPCIAVDYGSADLPPIVLPDGVRAVVSTYHGSHEERGEGNETIFVRADDGCELRASHGSHSGPVLRLGDRALEDDDLEAIRYYPEPRRYIVSTLFADAYRRQHGADDVELFVPDSGPSAIRENGQIVAVRALIRR